MFTEVPFFNYCIWSIIRLLLYQLLIIFSFYNFHDLPKYTLEFKEKMEQFAAISNIQFPPFIQEQLKNPENMFMIILAFAFISGVLATLGVKLFQFTSGIIILALAVVYYHPLKPSELGPNEQYDVLAQKYPWIDTVLISIFGVLMIFHSIRKFKDEDFYFLREDLGKGLMKESKQDTNIQDKESKKKR